MGLRINHNISALTSHRALASTDARLSKNLERLSTGLRINVAADDAAGLTISEKLRTQIRGLNRASLNIQDGISMIQTAEGALDQVHSMLQRMRELAVQSANDTLTSSDRLEIQKEVEQLKDQIDQVAYTTEFNTKKLLDGTSTAVVSSSAPNYLEGIAVGSLADFGDYSITVQANGENAGQPQKQRSNIFTKSDGTLASGTTTLESIAQFTDDVGNFILTNPQELYMIADNTQSHFTVSKDLTLQQLADRISIAVNDGLGLENSVTKITGIDDVTTSSIELKSGKVGRIGDLNFTGSEELVKALGFEITQKSVDAVYTVNATHLEQPTVNTVSTKIAGNRVTNLIQGMDLQFEPGRTASITGSIIATHGISIDSTENLEFHVMDTDGTSVGIVLYNDSANVTLNGTNITLPASASQGRYSAQQVVSFFNQAASTNFTDKTASVHHFLATRPVTTLNATTQFTGAVNTLSFNFGMDNLNFSVADGAGNGGTVTLTQHFESTASVANMITQSLANSGVLVSAVANNDKIRFYQKGGATGISLFNTNGGANDSTRDLDNLRKLGFSFAGGTLNMAAATGYIESSFALPSVDFTSVAGSGSVGPLSFAISQAGFGRTNIVVNEDVSSIGGLVSHINTQLINANSGVRASFTTTAAGPPANSTLQFYSANGPESFTLIDLGAGGIFTDSQNIATLGFVEGASPTSSTPPVSESPMGGDGSFSIRAALRSDGNISFYHQSEKGSASQITISIRSGGNANKLGIRNGRTTGVGGTSAILQSGTNLSVMRFGTGAAAGSIVLNVYDQHYDQLNGDNFTRLSFSGNANYSLDVIKNVFNQQLAQQDSDVRVSVTSAGGMNFYTQGGGAVAFVSVRELSVGEGFTKGAGDVSLAQFGFTTTAAPVPHLSGNGSNTSDATGPTVLGVIQKTDRIYGYEVGDFNTGAGDALRVRISDGSKTSGVISIPEGELSFGTAFYTGGEIQSIFESTLNAGSIGVNAKFDIEDRTFTFTSDNIGEDAKIHMLETSPGSNSMRQMFGINPDSYSGKGETKFKLHVKDTSVKFQIGANEGQQVTSNIIRTDTTALNVGKVDLTNIRSSTEAIDLLDQALSTISSERAKLGAIQNRMEYTKTSVDIANENLSSAESRIRDVDFAREVIEQTRNQILMQASTAQLAQANQVPQTVLQLLQG